VEGDELAAIWQEQRQDMRPITGTATGTAGHGAALPVSRAQGTATGTCGCQPFRRAASGFHPDEGDRRDEGADVSVWISTQNGHSFRREVKTAKYSRSAGVQYDRPRSIPAHPEHGVAEELRPVERHLGYRIDSSAGKLLSETDEHPGPQPMPRHQDRQAPSLRRPAHPTSPQ
jgi:hypothetical protein